MRILQVSPFFYPHSGGVESHVRGACRELVRQGHEPTVLTARHDRSLPREETFEGYRIVRASSWGVWFNTPVDPEASRLISGLSADVIHLHFPPPLHSYFAARGLRRQGTPACLTYHCDLYLPGPLGRLATGLYSRILLPSTLDRIQRIIVHTRSYGSTSRALRGRALEVVPSAVDVQRFRPDLDGSEIRQRLGLDGYRVLIFTGRLVPHKGVDLILRALPKLPSDVALLVVGTGPRLTDLAQLARRLDVLNRVRFCPQVSDEELPRYLRSADLFVFPSQNRLEGFGLVVAEAMASGLPVVIADIPGVREVIASGREGVLVDPLLEEDLAARLRELLADPARCRRMGSAGRQRAEERYDVRTVTRQLVTLYESLNAAG